MTSLNALYGASGGSSLFGSQKAPKYISNAFYLPPGFFRRATTVTTTANRCYYFPLAIQHPHTFQGATTYNQGTGDNGEFIRMMVFEDDGGPGDLLKDFGQITLDNTSAARTLSSSWAAVPGTYWGAIWFSAATAMYGMGHFIQSTNVGATMGGVYALDHAIGSMTADFGSSGSVSAHYVDTAYGAAPAAAVTPTASLLIAALVSDAVVPVFALKA